MIIEELHYFSFLHFGQVRRNGGQRRRAALAELGDFEGFQVGRHGRSAEAELVDARKRSRSLVQGERMRSFGPQRSGERDVPVLIEPEEERRSIQQN